MGNLINGIIAFGLFILLAIAGTSYIGPHYVEARIEAKAVDYLNQQSQIAKAIEHYASDKGRPPVEPGREPVEILISERYMTSAPLGGPSGWSMNSAAKSIVTEVGGSASEATQICIAARKRAAMPNPSNILRCDGSNAPGGALSLSDPCCLG